MAIRWIDGRPGLAGPQEKFVPVTRGTSSRRVEQAVLDAFWLHKRGDRSGFSGLSLPSPLQSDRSLAIKEAVRHQVSFVLSATPEFRSQIALRATRPSITAVELEECRSPGEAEEKRRRWEADGPHHESFVQTQTAQQHRM
jgi:hypothetical protein